MSRNYQSNVFGLRRPKWVQQPSARSNRREENFSWTRRTSCLESRNKTFLSSVGRNESNRYLLTGNGEKKIFHELEVQENFSWTRSTSCLESRNKTFLALGGRNESNRHLLAGIGEKKIFHELDVHHVWKVGIKRFWAQEAEMSLTGIFSPQSARRKFSWTQRTSCLEGKNKTVFFGLRRPKWV